MILKWKNEEDGDGNVTGKRPKARLVIKGFQDPNLFKIPKDSPTLSTVGRDLLFAVSSYHSWDLSIGDIKTAFLKVMTQSMIARFMEEMLNMTPNKFVRLGKPFTDC